MIKAFLFDYDGVVTTGVPDGTLAGRLANSLHIPEEAAWQEWIAPVWGPLLTGAMSEEDVFRVFEEKYGKPIGPQQRDIWFKWAELQPLPEMLTLLHKLKARGYALGVLSNATASTKKEIRDNGGYDAFDFVIISSEVGYKKPDAEIFALALQKLPGVQPSEVVFLDDRDSATNAAAQLGFKTIHVTDHAKAIHEVEDLIA